MHTLNPLRLLNFSCDFEVPLVIQSEAAECGLACLAMIIGAYGYQTDLSTLRRRFSISQHGIDLQQIMEIATELNLSVRALQLDLDHVNQLSLPCILHWDMNHFVVLKSVSSKHVTILDPSIGERKLSWSDFSNHFTGIALELSPTIDFEAKSDKRKLSLNIFWSKLIGAKSTLSLVILLSFLLQLLALCTPFYIQIVIDDVLIRQDTDLLLILAIGFSILFIINSLVTYIRSYIVLQFSMKLNIQIASNLFNHLLRLPISYFERRHMGDIVSRFSSLEEIKELLSNNIVSIIVDGTMSILIFVTLLYYNATISFILLGFICLYAAVRALFYRPIKRLSADQLVTHAKQETNFMESVRAIQTIKLFQKENERHNLWINRYANSLNDEIKISKWNMSFEGVKNLLFGCENIIVVYIGSLFVMEGALSIGMLLAILSYKLQFTTRMDQLISKTVEFKMISIHLERLTDIVFSPKESTPKELTASDKFGSGEIQVRNLTFKYSELDPPIFENLNFTIKPNESVAITGPSGCGKTTLLKCLMGLLPPTSGEILIDGKPISQVNNYRQHIAGVMQEDQLLSGNIAENISCFASSTCIDRVYECAIKAAIYDDIVDFPMQFNTLVGDMGTSLSGGQKQRILLARALYRNPSILFLDEATSHLDLSNESIINKHVKAMKVTRVMVAHRRETVLSANTVISLETESNFVEEKVCYA